MKVEHCPKCSQDPHVNMNPNNPAARFFAPGKGGIFVRECQSCGQRYCMSWKQWLIVILLNSLLTAAVSLMPVGDSSLLRLLCIGVWTLVQPLVFDVAQRHFSWKPVDAPYLDSFWRQALKTLIILGSVYIGTCLIVALVTG